MAQDDFHKEQLDLASKGRERQLMLAVFPDQPAAEKAAADIRAAGYQSSHIGVVSGEEALRQLEPAEKKEGFFAMINRAFVLSDEDRIMKWYANEARAGHAIFGLKEENMDKVGDLARRLKELGATRVTYFGTWTVLEC